MAMSSSSSSSGLTDIGKNDPQSASQVESTSLTKWRDKITVSIQRSRKVRGGNFVQIATVDPTSMEPRCRTVVFRGFLDTDDDNTTMKMITDRRSSKVSEASAGSTDGEEEYSNAEMVWWFSKSSEQYRIRGKLHFVGHDHPNRDLLTVRKAQWGNLSDSAREQFYWKEPGIPYQTDAEGDVPLGGRSEGKVLPPPDEFLLMLLTPNRVDYLRLGDNYRQLDEIVNGQWTMARVNP